MPLTNMAKLQMEVEAWSKRNFPDQTGSMTIHGVTEEFGELALAFLDLMGVAGGLSQAMLKREQQVRGTPMEHEARAKDSVGDAVIFLTHFCCVMGWDIDAIISDTWGGVKNRNWKANPKDGT